MEALRIRDAEASDTALIWKFIRELAAYERLEHAMVASEADLQRSLFGNPKYAEVILAEWDGLPAGFALFFHNYSTFLGRPGVYLEDLFVTPELRGKGIGKALLRRLAQITVERDCGRLEWAVLDWNEPSIEIYKRLGAEPMDEWTVYRVAGEALRALANLGSTG